jgi:PAS domain-containing protein
MHTEDISSRKNVEEQLRVSERQMETLKCRYRNGTKRSKGHLIKANRALCSILGYSENELLKLTFEI